MPCRFEKRGKRHTPLCLLSLCTMHFSCYSLTLLLISIYSLLSVVTIDSFTFINRRPIKHSTCTNNLQFAKKVVDVDEGIKNEPTSPYFFATVADSNSTNTGAAIGTAAAVGGAAVVISEGAGTTTGE